MGDPISQLSAEEMADLSALADGTLPSERRAALEARLAASPELRELFERQLRAVAATRQLASEPAPASLAARVRQRVPALDTRRGRRRRFVPRLALGGAALAAVTLALVLTLSGGAGGPTAADAARLAALPPTAPAPGRLDDSRTKLAIGVEGVVFPDLRSSYGWRPVGVRRTRFDGHSASIVTYAKDRERIGYVIVGGDALPEPSGADTMTIRGVEFRSFRVGGLPAVTWQRQGHTCVLTGAASPAELLALASWRGGGARL